MSCTSLSCTDVEQTTVDVEQDRTPEAEEANHSDKAGGAEADDDFHDARSPSSVADFRQAVAHPESIWTMCGPSWDLVWTMRGPMRFHVCVCLTFFKRAP